MEKDLIEKNVISIYDDISNDLKASIYLAVISETSKE